MHTSRDQWGGRQWWLRRLGAVVVPDPKAAGCKTPHGTSSHAGLHAVALGQRAVVVAPSAHVRDLSLERAALFFKRLLLPLRGIGVYVRPQVVYVLLDFCLQP